MIPTEHEAGIVLDRKEQDRQSMHSGLLHLVTAFASCMLSEFDKINSTLTTRATSEQVLSTQVPQSTCSFFFRTHQILTRQDVFGVQLNAITITCYALLERGYIGGLCEPFVIHRSFGKRDLRQKLIGYSFRLVSKLCSFD